MNPARRAMPLVLATLLLVASAPAAEASTPPPQDVWTVFTTVRADIQGNLATVEVIADIGNEGPDPEFPFAVRVPDDALVTGLKIERDGETHVARIAPREEARTEYEEWKSQEQTGGLVEKTRRSDVYAYLINVAEFTSVRATLTYERYLAADEGIHNLSLEAPVSGFGRDLGARFEVTVHDADGAWASAGQTYRTGGAWKLQHSVGPRSSDAPTQWQASYTMPVATTDGIGELVTTVHNGTGYFAHRFRADPDARQVPMDLVLVLDVSGSMGGPKIAQLRDAATQVVRSLSAEDRLHLALFSSGVTSPWDGLRAMTPEARRDAASEVENLFAGGGTNIEGGLRAAIRALADATPAEQESRLQLVAFLSDGRPTDGNTDHGALRGLAREARDDGARVYTIAFGHDADWPLLYDLGADGGGSALLVPEGAGAEVDIRRFLAALTTPVLHNVAVEYGPGVLARNAYTDILLAGSELLIVGTFDPTVGVSGTVSYVGPDGALSRTFAGGTPTNATFLPRLVAYHEVRHLQDLLDTQGLDGAVVDRIVDVALEHGFVTDHTSLVLTLSARAMRAGDASWDPRLVQGSDASGRPTGNFATTSTAPTPTPTQPTAHTTALSGDRTFETSYQPTDDAWTASRSDEAGAAATGPKARTGGGSDAEAPAMGSGPGAAEVPSPALALVLVGLAALALWTPRRQHR